MVEPAGQPVEASVQRLRLRSRRQVNRVTANPIQGNLGLSPLRATAGPPRAAPPESSPAVSSPAVSSPAVRPSDPGRRGSSRFDLPRNAQGFQSRLKVHVRVTNPLTAGLSRPSEESLGRSMASASSRISQQRAKSSFIDGHSRLLRAQSNANRTSKGFEIDLNPPTFSILG